MKRMQVLLFAGAAVAMSSFGGVAQAVVITDTNLAAPGVYYGSGNVNGHFAVNTVGNLELGLRAIERYIGPITPVGNVYTVPLGDTTVPTKTGANWGFDFSANARAGGGTSTLSNYVFRLTLTDVAQGTTGFFDPGLIPDNAQYGPSGKVQCPNIACVPTTNWAFQNSEALSFLGIKLAFLDPLYNDNINDTLFLTLGAYNADAVLLASDTIKIVQGAGASVPEPATLALFGAGLAGLGALRRRRKAKA